MCFDHDSRPPVAPVAGGALDGTRETLRSADGTRFSAFHAAAERSSGAAMLVLPDVRGLHPYYEELALRFAEAGIDALAVDYFGRTAGTTPRGADFDHAPHVGQVRWQQLSADIAAGAEELRARHRLRGLFTIGFCFGGRLSLLSGTRDELAVSGSIGFYGWPAGPSRGEVPAPIDLVDRMGAPVLALFGGADEGIPAEVRDDFAAALERAGVANELVTYDGAPHSFFDRKAEEHADASADAWRRVLDFVRRNTPS